jgi:ABC-type multidrug transport system ATPase subunit
MVAARHAGAHQFLTSLPGGYDTILGPEFSGGNDLSIGQWQRIALARAFFRDAPFIILDEPTAALDARAEHDLFQAISTLCHGRSVLLISHRFSSVRTADRIYVLHHGHVVQHGTHDQLMAAGGLYADLSPSKPPPTSTKTPPTESSQRANGDSDPGEQERSAVPLNQSGRGGRARFHSWVLTASSRPTHGSRLEVSPMIAFTVRSVSRACRMLAIPRHDNSTAPLR